MKFLSPIRDLISDLSHKAYTLGLPVPPFPQMQELLDWISDDRANVLRKNSAGFFISRIQGMLKAAQKAKPDLVNWFRPTLKVNRTPEFEHHVLSSQNMQPLYRRY